MRHHGTALEAAYGRNTMPSGFPGLKAALYGDDMRVIANRRRAQLDPALSGNSWNRVFATSPPALASAKAMNPLRAIGFCWLR